MTTIPWIGRRVHSADRVMGRPVGRRRTLHAFLAGIGLLATALAVSPQGQVERPGRKVSGTVVAAATRQPIPNARVQYEEAGQTPQTTVTDAKGNFEFPAGRVGVLTVTARGFGTARRGWPPVNPTLRVELVPPAILAGTVGDLATGRLVEALVNVMVQHPGNFVSNAAFAERGTFRIEDLPPGPALVTARSEGFAPYLGSTTVEGGKVRDVRIGLLLEAQATGHVRDARGEPVTGASVSAVYSDLAGAGVLEGFVGGRSLTRADGVFALRGLVPDTTIALRAELDGRRSAVETISVGPGTRRSGLVLTLP